ncbi:MAG: hypothetical protein ABIF11_07300 [Nitrospirota bacterium]
MEEQYMFYIILAIWTLFFIWAFSLSAMLFNRLKQIIEALNQIIDSLRKRE